MSDTQVRRPVPTVQAPNCRLETCNCICRANAKKVHFWRLSRMQAEKQAAKTIYSVERRGEVSWQTLLFHSCHDERSLYRNAPADTGSHNRGRRWSPAPMYHGAGQKCVLNSAAAWSKFRWQTPIRWFIIVHPAVNDAGSNRPCSFIRHYCTTSLVPDYAEPDSS